MCIAPLRDAILDFSQLTPGQRRLTKAGYLIIAALLVMTLGFELLADVMPSVTFSRLYEGAPVPRQIPLPVLIVSSLGMVVGWAYLLAGATDGRRWIFALVMLLFAGQLIFMSPLVSTTEGKILTSDWAAYLFVITAPLFWIAALAIYFFTPRAAAWRQYPVIEFSFWLIALLFYLALLWLGSPTWGDVAVSLNGSFSVLSLLTIPWWALSGLVVGDVALTFGSRVTYALRLIFPQKALHALALFLLLVYPALILFPMSLDQTDTVLAITSLFNALFSVLLLLGLGALFAIKRWRATYTYRLLTLTLMAPILALAVTLALSGINIGSVLSLASMGAGFLPPLMAFVALMAHSVLRMSASFAAADTTGAADERLPRSGRLLMGMGAAILITSFTIFFVNVRTMEGQLDAAFEGMVAGLFTLSAFFLGMPYTLWRAWRSRRYLGGDPDAPLTPVFQDRTQSTEPWLVWAIIAAALAIFGMCLLIGGN